jgi:cytidine deaminase
MPSGSALSSNRSGRMTDDQELIRRATEVLNSRRLSPTVEAGGVGSALVTDKGNVYVGVCIDAACGLGFCAEHNAIGNMITNGESKIISIVAVGCDGNILPPCGKCREFIYQVDPHNVESRILLPNGAVKKLRELLPDYWKGQ